MPSRADFRGRRITSPESKATEGITTPYFQPLLPSDRYIFGSNKIRIVVVTDFGLRDRRLDG